MEKVRISSLGGRTLQERIDMAKSFFGLSPEQSFQDLDVDEIEDEE